LKNRGGKGESPKRKKGEEKKEGIGILRVERRFSAQGLHTKSGYYSALTKNFQREKKKTSFKGGGTGGEGGGAKGGDQKIRWVRRRGGISYDQP